MPLYENTGTWLWISGRLCFIIKLTLSQDICNTSFNYSKTLLRYFLLFQNIQNFYNVVQYLRIYYKIYLYVNISNTSYSFIERITYFMTLPYCRGALSVVLVLVRYFLLFQNISKILTMLYNIWELITKSILLKIFQIHLKIS